MHAGFSRRGSRLTSPPPLNLCLPVLRLSAVSPRQARGVSPPPVWSLFSGASRRFLAAALVHHTYALYCGCAAISLWEISARSRISRAALVK